MEIMKRLLIFTFLSVFACKTENNNIDLEDNEAVKGLVKLSIKEQDSLLKKKGFNTFHYVDEKTKDTFLMQEYYIAFLKSGPIRNQSKEEAKLLQDQHLAHLGKMYEMGFADISGPFGDDGDIRGITIYNVPNQQLADSLANADPMVKSGRLKVEIHPWWAAKGFKLR